MKTFDTMVNEKNILGIHYLAHYTLGYVARLAAPFAIYQFHQFYQANKSLYIGQLINWGAYTNIAYYSLGAIGILLAVLIAMTKLVSFKAGLVSAILAGAAIHYLTGMGSVFGKLYIYGALTGAITAYAIGMMFAMIEPVAVKWVLVFWMLFTVGVYIYTAFFIVLDGLLAIPHMYITNPGFAIWAIFAILFITPIVGFIAVLNAE